MSYFHFLPSNCLCFWVFFIPFPPNPGRLDENIQVMLNVPPCYSPSSTCLIVASTKELPHPVPEEPTLVWVKARSAPKGLFSAWGLHLFLPQTNSSVQEGLTMVAKVLKNTPWIRGNSNWGWGWLSRLHRGPWSFTTRRDARALQRIILTKQHCMR